MTVNSEMLLWALGWSLIHFLWQGVVVAGVVAAVLFLMKDRPSRERYLVWCSGLFLLALLPGITLISYLSGSVADESLTRETALLLEGSEPAILWEGFVVALWAGGVFLFLSRLLGGWIRVMRTKREAREFLSPIWITKFRQLTESLQVEARARLTRSASVAVPVVIGWLKPVVIVPARIFTELSDDQIEAILVHELAHVRRHDYVVNLLQSVVETLLFYHPAVWWVSRGIRAEREFCCDDVAVSRSSDALRYARALLELEAWRSRQFDLQMSTLGGSLMHRVFRIVGLDTSIKGKGAGRSVALSATLIAVGAVSAIAAINDRGDQDLFAPPASEAKNAALEAGSLLPPVVVPATAPSRLPPATDAPTPRSGLFGRKKAPALVPPGGLLPPSAPESPREGLFGPGSGPTAASPFGGPGAGGPATPSIFGPGEAPPGVRIRSSGGGCRADESPSSCPNCGAPQEGAKSSPPRRRFAPGDNPGQHPVPKAAPRRRSAPGRQARVPRRTEERRDFRLDDEVNDAPDWVEKPSKPPGLPWSLKRRSPRLERQEQAPRFDSRSLDAPQKRERNEWFERSPRPDASQTREMNEWFERAPRPDAPPTEMNEWLERVPRPEWKERERLPQDRRFRAPSRTERPKTHPNRWLERESDSQAIKRTSPWPEKSLPRLQLERKAGPPVEKRKPGRKARKKKRVEVI